MASKAEVILKDLKAGKYAPVYFLQGEEPFFIDQISDFVETNAIAEHEKGFNQVVMYGKDAQMNEILSNARRFPMMADRQVVIVKEAQNIYGLGKEDIDNLLIQYLQNPLPSTILVFAHKYKKLDGRKPLSKELDKKAILVTSDKVKDWDLGKWIEAYIIEKGHQIDSPTATFLADSIGNNLEVIANELGKMFINFNEPTKITKDHIQRFIGINKEYNTFELTKAIGFKDVIKANKIIHYFSQNPKSHPLIPIIALVYSYFNKVALIHYNSSLGDAELSKKVGVHPYFLKEYRVAVRNYHLGKVIDCLTYIREADLRSKGVDSGGMEHSEILREMIFKIMH
ncbi:DNA polymerase III subunit delta [Mongoliibacter ruber]|uniref:DNA polymerase III subunit delta n=1 Tax=Mongoliibacter ruber TaxID=1750599 RepID=A0A2T0WW47_9BACT|nr:DNA polymerase III subunit delta [Mongoliibacter ruber]PRY90911.1 DNA polymerase III delta subunit [Mongoliibacter ruber]